MTKTILIKKEQVCTLESYVIKVLNSFKLNLCNLKLYLNKNTNKNMLLGKKYM